MFGHLFGYSAAILLLIVALLQRLNLTWLATAWLQLLALVALACQAPLLYGLLVQPEGINLGLFNLATFIGWVISLFLLITSLRLPLHILFCLVFPLNSLAIFAALLIPDPPVLIVSYNTVLIHVFISIIAYSILALAMAQALLITCQDYHLKRHQLTSIISRLPPLETMEGFLFQLLISGFLLLTLALITGAFFLEDIFKQHVVHKTVLSIVAWLIFSVLLAGHYFFGWRGRTITRWTLAGFFILAVSFFGSKFVLEVILKL
jgi:ABC-type uncharacterized transport system permease subunit